MAAMPDTLDDFKRGMAEEFLRKTGFLHLQVLGQSMLPGIWPGDVLTIETKIANEMEIGDIGLFRRNARFFVHRVKNKLILDGSLHLLARGDSAWKNDPLFPAHALLGRVVEVQHGNRITVPVREPALCARLLGWLFASCSTARNLALRLDRIRRDRKQAAEPSMIHESECWGRVPRESE
jgi:peptidase S24-like protein